MSEGNGIPSKAAVDLAVHAILKQQDLIADEKLDMSKLRNRLFEAIVSAKVLAKKERAEKAVQRPQLLEALFPSLPAPEQFDHQADPPLAEKVYGWFDTKVWGETKSSADSAVQRLVGVNMGNGYVMCRTKIGRVDAVYITDNIDCIREDFTRPEADAITRKLKMATKNREMLVLRQPENATKYANEYNRALRAELATASAQMQLAVDSVSGNHADDEGDETKAAAMFEPHALAKVLPAMSGEDYERLRTDVKANGLLEPIMLYEGKVLDGIHRQKACAEAKVKPRYEKFSGDDPTRFVFSRNLARRHLSKSELAMIAADLLPRRMTSGQPTTAQKNRAQVPHSPQTIAEAADLAGVSERYVKEAREVKKKNPALARKVRSGKVTLSSARDEVRGRGRSKNWNGKTNPTRERELRAEKNGTRVRKGNYNDLLRLSLDMNRACSIIEAYHVDDFDLEATTLDLVDTFHDDLITLAQWVDRATMATQAWLGDVKVRRKIEALRNTVGRTPEETKNFIRVADNLERKLEAFLPSGV